MLLVRMNRGRGGPVRHSESIGRGGRTCEVNGSFPHCGFPLSFVVAASQTRGEENRFRTRPIKRAKIRDPSRRPRPTRRRSGPQPAEWQERWRWASTACSAGFAASRAKPLRLPSGISSSPARSLPPWQTLLGTANQASSRRDRAAPWRTDPRWRDAGWRFPGPWP